MYFEHLEHYFMEKIRWQLVTLFNSPHFLQQVQLLQQQKTAPRRAIVIEIYFEAKSDEHDATLMLSPPPGRHIVTKQYL